eukprot:m.312044 g.312044  ORF g.312044 m.312044 type:complete len:348 (-) comp20233_c0_seq20:746-1789(-)
MNYEISDTKQKYYGYNKKIKLGDARSERVVSLLQEAVTLVEKKSDNGEHFAVKQLGKDLRELLQYVIHNQEDGIASYKIALIQTLCEYVRKRATKRRLMGFLRGGVGGIPLDRYHQLHQFTRIIVISDDSATGEHPAVCLSSCERINQHVGKYDFGTLTGLTSSSTLQKSMGRCLETLWEPILYDNRQVLRKMGINLFLLGLVVVLGETIVMLYPLVHLLKVGFLAVLSANASLQQNQGTSREVLLFGLVTPRAAVDVFRAVMLLWAASVLCSIVATYSAAGNTCLIVGVGALCVAQERSDVLLKRVVPVSTKLGNQAEAIESVANHMEALVSTAVRKIRRRPALRQ